MLVAMLLATVMLGLAILWSSVEPSVVAILLGWTHWPSASRVQGNTGFEGLSTGPNMALPSSNASSIERAMPTRGS